MAIPEIVDGLQALSISNPEYLLFCPSGEKAPLEKKFDNVPRYLFRVFTPKSRGMTDRFWTKSMDARDGNKNSQVEIFTRDDKQVASMLNRHLRWWEGDKDNLISWTSSLLFALVYMFHLHANIRDGSSFDDIKLCIIDTDKFPKGIFLRDMDLITIYSPFDPDLKNFEGLRLKPDWYFGEYLSQGALKIEDKCRIVSAQQMIEKGLCELRHEFEEFSNWEISGKPPWAKKVVNLRKELYLYPIRDPEKLEDKLRIAIDIAQLFGSHWALPVAANLAALIPPPEHDTAIEKAFRASVFTDDDRENSSPMKTKVITYDTLPEVEHFNKIMQIVYRDFCVTKLRNYIIQAERQLRSAIVFAKTHGLVYQEPALLEPMKEAVKRRIDKEAAVSQKLRELIEGRQAFP